jgi:hypothetical protein
VLSPALQAALYPRKIHEPARQLRRDGHELCHGRTQEEDLLVHVDRLRVCLELLLEAESLAAAAMRPA